MHGWPVQSKQVSKLDANEEDYENFSYCQVLCDGSLDVTVVLYRILVN